jgi:hypothetical protein
VHDLLTETAHSAAYKCWRQAGAASPEAAVSGFVSKYRRRWGSVARLGMARLKLARVEMARPVHSTLGPRQRVTDFNPRSHVDFGDATHPVVGGALTTAAPRGVVCPQPTLAAECLRLLLSRPFFGPLFSFAVCACVCPCLGMVQGSLSFFT